MKTVYRYFLLFVWVFVGISFWAHANTYTVTSLGDNGVGTLRQAILDANNNVGGAPPHLINFAVTGSIDITSVTLPNIFRQTTIDGGNLGDVVINCNNSADFGFYIADGSTANSVIKNLVINNYKIHGIVIVGVASNITIENCRIGTNAAGTASSTLANSVHGFALTNSSGNTIKNCLISGNKAMGIQISNCTNTTIKGNIIGLNASGTAAIPNLQSGIQMVNNSTSNFIGGNNAGDGNVISGNSQHGISFVTGCNSNQIKGNVIGLNVAGNTAIGNGFSGIQFSTSCTGNLIGGTTKNERNVLSGNGNCGVQLLSDCNYNIVQGNYIGTDSSGTIARGNSQNGVLFDVSAAHNSAIGNVISANLFSGVYLGAKANYTTIKGNIIGLNKNGNGVLGNVQNGISMASSSFNTVGGISIQDRNVVSGNGNGNIGFGPDQFSGISASTYDANPARDNIIQGNYIGVGADGITPFENGNHGIWIFRDGGSSSNVSFSILNNIISANASNNSTIKNEQNRSLIYVYRATLPSLIQGNTLLRPRNAGLWLSSLSNLTVGGSNSNEGNTILNSQNNGIQIEGSSDNLFIGNAIGTDITGTLTGGNSGAGINFTGVSERNQIGGTGAGQANLIANNLTNGLNLSVAASKFNPIRGNSIFCNTGKGIQLNALGNENIAVPFINPLSGTSTVFGTALPNAQVDLYYFATCNPCTGTNLQGKTYINTITADGSGQWSYISGVSNLQITATQTNSNKSTSEFSPRNVLALAGATTCGAVSDVTINLSGATSGDIYNAFVNGNLVTSSVSGNGTVGLTISTTNLMIGNNPVTITSSVFGCGIFTTSTTNIKYHPVVTSLSSAVNSICPGLNATITLTSVNPSISYYLATSGGIAISSPVTGSGTLLIPFQSSTLPVGGYSIEVYGSVAGCVPVQVANPFLSINSFSNNGIVLSNATICGGGLGATITLSGAVIGDQYNAFAGATFLTSVTATQENIVFNISTSSLTQGINSINVYKSRLGCGTTAGIPSTILVNPNASNVTASSAGICVGSNATFTVSGAQSGFSYYLTTGSGLVMSNVSTGSGLMNLVVNSSGLPAGNYSFDVQASIAGCGVSQVGTASLDIISPIDNAVLTPTTICGSATSVSISISDAALNQSYNAFINNTLVSNAIATSTSFNLGIGTASLAFGDNQVLVKRDLMGCGTITVGSVNIRYTPSLNTLTVNPVSICLGQTAVLTISGASLGYAYFASTGSGISLGAASTGSGVLLVQAGTSSFTSGVYPIYITSTIDGCSPVLSATTITVFAPNNIVVQPLGPDTVCQFQTANFTTSVTGFFSWNIPSDAALTTLNSDSSLVQIRFGTTTGMVKIRAYDVCSSTFGSPSEKPVVVLSKPIAFSGGSFLNQGDLIKKYPTKTKEGAVVLSGIGSSQLSAGETKPNYTYNWSINPETEITNKNAIQSSFQPNSIESKVFLTVSNGYCSSTDSSLVEVDIDQIPAAFSPNDDLTNQTWQIDNLYLYKNVKITVFNKWGSPVYESKGYPKEKEQMWNGKSNGVDLPVAVYYYIIDFNNERGKAVRNGTVTIVR